MMSYPSVDVHFACKAISHRQAAFVIYLHRLGLRAIESCRCVTAFDPVSRRLLSTYVTASQVSAFRAAFTTKRFSPSVPRLE
jgi:hypothetical protein